MVKTAPIVYRRGIIERIYEICIEPMLTTIEMKKKRNTWSTKKNTKDFLWVLDPTAIRVMTTAEFSGENHQNERIAI